MSPYVMAGEQSQLDRIEEDIMLMKEVLAHRIIELAKSSAEQNQRICETITQSNKELFGILREVGGNVKDNTKEMHITMKFQKQMLREARMAIPVGAFLLLVAAFFGLLFGPESMKWILTHQAFAM